MNWFTRKIIKIKGIKDREVESIDIWTVSWKARKGNYHDDYSFKFVAFFNEKDAKEFKEDLERCQQLLQYTENLHIKITKNK